MSGLCRRCSCFFRIAEARPRLRFVLSPPSSPRFPGNVKVVCCPAEVRGTTFAPLIQEDRQAEGRLDVEVEAGNFFERAFKDGAVAGLERHDEGQRRM